jgi:formylglycine-generating enzyme required for sulfatase activity
MKRKTYTILVWLLTSAILVACGPSQAELDAQATQLAATQTAKAAIPTPTPTSTPTPTNTSLPPTNTPVPPTDTPTPTDTPPPTDTPIPPTATPTPTPAPPTFTPTPPPTPTPALGIGSTRVREQDGAIMVYVPAGTFQMGTDAETAITECEKIKISKGWVCRPDIFKNAEPIHAVTLDAFYIDKHEVTNAQYNLCAAAGVCVGGNPEAAWSDYPVTFVPWAQAQAYCQWAGGNFPPKHNGNTQLEVLMGPCILGVIHLIAQKQIQKEMMTAMSAMLRLVVFQLGPVGLGRRR